MKKKIGYVCISTCMFLAFLALVRASRDGDKPVKEAPPKIAANRIAQVTVYPSCALITREVDAPAGMGNMELVVNPLPPQTITNSLYSEGSDGIRVLTTRFRTRPVEEDTREEVRKLDNEHRNLLNQQQSLTAELKALGDNMALLSKLEAFTAANTTHATEKGKMDSDATIALAKYLMDGRTEKSREMVKLNQQLQSIAEQQAFVQRKLSELTAGSSKTELDAVIVVDKTNNAPGKIRLNYLVASAAWRPQYKIRAGKLATDAVQVEYLAAIMQQTGEDWRDVNMVLSTAEPMLNAAPPELKILAVKIVPRSALAAAKGPGLPALGGMIGGGNGMMGMGGMGGLGFQGGQRAIGGQIGQAGQIGPGGQIGNAGQLSQGGQQGQIPNMPQFEVPKSIDNPAGNVSVKELDDAIKSYRALAQQENNLRNETTSSELWNFASNLEQARDLVLSAEQKKSAQSKARAKTNEGPSVTYHLNTRLTVPSRNDEQVIEVARLEMAPDYFYKAVPVVSPHVYRQANLVNKTTHVLLPGEATMYHDKDFVGRMNLPLVAIGEQFTVGFGTEPQLQVNRQMMDKSRAMQGGNQVLKYEYRILISSYKPEKVKLQLWDRLPQAENETMNITLVKTSPEVSKDPLYLREERPGNLLRWDLDVEPEANGEKAQSVSYDFRLEFDKQMTIGSFQSK